MADVLGLVKWQDSGVQHTVCFLLFDLVREDGLENDLENELANINKKP